MTENEITAADPRAQLVGLAAYLDAGGRTRTDLFSDDARGTYLLDADILQRLVNDKLSSIAATLKEQGWGWVHVQPEPLGYNDYSKYTVLPSTRRKPTDAEAKTIKDIESQCDKLDKLSEKNDGFTDEQEEQYQQLTDKKREIEESLIVWSAKTMHVTQAVFKGVAQAIKRL